MLNHNNTWELHGFERGGHIYQMDCSLDIDFMSILPKPILVAQDEHLQIMDHQKGRGRLQTRVAQPKALHRALNDKLAEAQETSVLE
jgi:hypothetical protein